MGIAFTPDLAQQLKFVAGAGFVPGGRLGFYTVTQVEDEARDVQSLWVFERDGSGTRRLGESLGDVRSPSPSPDGQTFVLLADADGVRQMFLVPIDGGAPRQLTSIPQGVAGAPAWSPDGRSLAFTVGPEPRDRSLPYRLDRVTYRFDGLGYLDDVVTDIYVADVSSGSVRRLTNDRNMNADPRWSPDGRSLCYLVSHRPDRAWSMLPELHVLDVGTGASRAAVDPKWGGVFGAVWSADGERLVFHGTPGTETLYVTTKMDLWTIPAAGGEPECRTASIVAGVGSLVQADLPISDELSAHRIRVHGDTAYTTGQVAGDVVVYRIALRGPEDVAVVAGGDGSAYLADADPEGALLYQATTPAGPPDLMLGSTRITSLNDELLSKIDRPIVHHVKATASDGLTTDVWILTPPDESGPRPTVLYVHGGPYGAFGTTYGIDFHLLVGAGYAVVAHNFRGSGGYGSEFSRMVSGDWGGNGSLDHHAALDEAIRLGIADPERLGVCGLSHGGFATCWLVGTSDRFKAAVAENPVTSWTSAYGNVDSEWWIPLEHGGTPFEVPDVYRERSPFTYARNCRTPILFVVGEQDMRCHPMESEQYYRVVKANGVPTEMVRMPDASHTGSWNGPVAARAAQNEALVDWFRRYL